MLKKQADTFFVETENGKVLGTTSRKTLKKDGVFVGDRVTLDAAGAISKIDKRKNLLIRPPLANLDKMLIVVAPVPKPDLYTVDKLLLFCAVSGIQPVLCINKCDLDEKYCKDIQLIYQKFVKTIIFSTREQSVMKILEEIDGICALAGQSAVGKSSIINSILGRDVAKVDTFSKKIERGKQTTRTVELYKLAEGKYLADTAGFSKLDERLLRLNEQELKSYYPDFLPFAGGCKYTSCQHLTAKDCAVCKAVEEGKISKQRYSNYLKLHEVLKNIPKF